jgi:hypothetical protein
VDRELAIDRGGSGLAREAGQSVQGKRAGAAAGFEHQFLRIQLGNGPTADWPAMVWLQFRAGGQRAPSNTLNINTNVDPV